MAAAAAAKQQLPAPTLPPHRRVVLASALRGDGDPTAQHFSVREGSCVVHCLRG